MPPDDFALANRTEVPTSFLGRASADASLGPIFNRPGSYEAYVSDNLESEQGGCMCSFKYVGMSHNYSFKPNR